MKDHTKRIVKELGQRIRRLRKARGLTQAEFSEMTGLTQGYLSRTEGGYAEISLETLWIIAGSLDVTLSTLLKDIEFV
jgi:transcriptional regulator with XRE-family HTH domain